ncbi:LysR family transcriptional regulator [Pelagibius sp. Alg239-R121]|uniref:LysR family transcriptional regulator n=1 Tax=Pelagibius sp. Alg239-R121 TaxID=2993448 RepID=UPI0024A6A27F|nr:LysR family transcriptional regulator [Pelagibius sp. Alg239-R121]
MGHFCQMNRALPPLTWFRAFEASARHLSFTLAAGELNVTQSAVSQHVRALEQKFAVMLFERKPRGLALTEAGRRLLPYAASAVDELAKATAMFLPRVHAERLDIACTTTFAVVWLVPRLERFRRANPDVTLRLLSTLWPDDYLTEKTDIQIRFGSRALLNDEPALTIEDNIIPVCTPDLAPSIDRTDSLWDLPMIETIGALYSWERWSQEAGLPTPPAPKFVVDSMILAKTMAESGEGVALASRFICRDSISQGQLIVPIDRPVSSDDCFSVSLSEFTTEKPAAKAFYDWLLSEIGDEAFLVTALD